MKKKSLLFLCLTCIGLFLFSCKKADLPIENSATTTIKPKTSSYSATDIVTRTRNLAVVYFIPSDLDTVAGWQTRLPEVMAYAQEWYGLQMQAAGYGNKTFSLSKDPVTLKTQIVLIRGNSPKATYGTSASAYKTEVDAYFASHSGLKTSNHVLILIPAFGYDNNSVEGPQPLEGVQPFYGSGRYCFAMDNVYMDMALKGVINTGRNNFAKWVGGMMHEIGHAFNAPHDKQKVSQNIWPGANFKEPIMALSNYYLEVRPCFITDATAAIFDRCEVFNSDASTYYGAVTTNISKIYAGYNATSGNIEVSGKYNSTGTVSKFTYFLDPNVNNEGTGTNKDYNAITWATPSIGTDSFNVSIPIAELQYKTNGIPYEFKIRTVHTNGTITETIYFFTFQSGIPVINFGTKPELSKSGWTIAGFSTQQNTTSESAAKVLDNDPATFWHSKWSGTPTGTYPHYVSIDLGVAKTAKGVSLLHRAGAYRSIKNFELLTSNDGVSFTSMGNYVAQNVTTSQYFDFSTPQTFRYFKIIANSSWDGTQNAAIAELGLYN